VRRGDRGVRGVGSIWLLAAALTVALGGCGTFSALTKSDDVLTAGLQDSGMSAAELTPSAPTLAAAGVEMEHPATDATPEIAPVDHAGALVSGHPAVVGEQPEEPAAEVAGASTLPSLLEETDGVPAAPALLDAGLGSALAQSAQDPLDAFEEEYDPWEPFNEKMFEFNRGVDRWVLKPTARAYMFVMPEPWQVLIGNGFDNINFVPRFVNSLLQGKWGGAGRELGRFLINSTAGIGGLFDPAKDYWGIPKSREDFGQTLGVWGSGPGPYLVLPFLEPLTVRDGIGKLVDSFMDPLTYFLPFFWDRLGMKVGDIVNERALNYELFQGFEESVIDMYSAVRHGYLQRRQQLIKE
jgi:phospholipid-binding lipoprotein MlaA